jgi:NAD(P)-dependent dehydrogenase (short-subunit alcohol dehydrogenase family)
LATVQSLVAEGASVLMIARDPERLADAVASCPEGPGAVDSLSLDVTAPSAGRDLLAAAVERFGAVDGLVNAAGHAQAAPLEQVPDAEWLAQWELNVMAPKRLMDAIAPGMAGGGSIVNVCSSAGRRPSSTYGAYAVAKRGQLALTKAYAQRFGPTGVRVNAVAPGPTETPLWLRPEGLLDQLDAEDGEPAEKLARRARQLPLGRFAQPAEIASVIVALLATTGSSSGMTWAVDGGHAGEVFD